MERPHNTDTRVRDSGATGGPATGGGVDYQINVAIDLALDLISRVVTASPTHRQHLVIEPRLTHEDGLTRWDIRITPFDMAAYEAKLTPSKKDVNDWLARAVEGHRGAPNATFHLAFGDNPSSYLRDVIAMIRVANEAGGDKKAFEALLPFENLQCADEIIGILGDKAYLIARQMKTWPLSEISITKQIESQLRYMVAPEHALILRNSLKARFLEAMKPRLSFFIPQLVTQLEAEGIRFRRPESLTLTGVPPSVAKACYVLQKCTDGLPTDVIATICGLEPDDFVAQAADYDYLLHESCGFWTHTPLGSAIEHPDAAALIGRAIEVILANIRANTASPIFAHLVKTVFDLAFKAESLNPAAAMSVFDPLDKPLKRAGRKRDVLELARLTIRVANTIPTRDTKVIEAEALAMICGESWTFQRIGDLAKAEELALASQNLGETVGYKRNTAFCLKCRGRLRRVEGDREQRGKKQSSLFNKSIDLLTEAITTFSDHPKYGPISDEIADCNSLLGRTYLSMGNLKKANEHAGVARSLFKSETSKHYMDLLLLEGEIASASMEHELADEKYQAALALVGQGDAERSEIAARAHLCRGINLHKWCQPGAEEEIAKAGKIWRLLKEHYCAGVADWAAVMIAGPIPPIVEKRTKGKPPSVKVEILKQYTQFMAESRSRALAQRDEITDAAWTELVRRAEETDAIRNRRW